MMKSTVVLSLLVFVTFASASNTIGRTDAVSSAVDDAARAFMENGQTVGLSVGVLKDGKQYVYNYGTMERGERRPPTARTVYPIASITKTFTGALVAQAVVEGKLRLDDDVRKYLPGEYPNLEYGGTPIRIVHLLVHSSGLPNGISEKASVLFAPGDDAARRSAKEAEFFKSYSREDFFRDLRTVKLTTVPGERFMYSNPGAQLVGLVLERVYGRSYDELVDAKIAAPLGMHDTKVLSSPLEIARLPMAYSASGPFRPYLPARFPAAGALTSTLADMLKYTQWNLAERDEALKLAHKPAWYALRPQDDTYAIALNWQTRQLPTYRCVWQDGHIPGFRSLCVLYPELNVGLVVLANEEERAASTELSPMIKQIMTAVDPRITFTP